MSCMSYNSDLSPVMWEVAPVSMIQFTAMRSVRGDAWSAYDVGLAAVGVEGASPSLRRILGHWMRLILLRQVIAVEVWI